MSESTTVSTADGPMIVHWAKPSAPAAPHSLPGILVFQEAFGVNGHILRVCQRLADEGFVAAAPELFHRAGAGLTMGYEDFPKIRPIMGALTNQTLLTDIVAAHTALAADPLVDPKRTSAIGFCLGGFAAVLAALNLPLATAVSFYGGGMTKARPGMGLTPLVDEFARLKCPTLFGFGEKDASITAEDVALIRSRLNALHGPHEVVVYPEAGHGFFCEDRPAYQPQAAQAAWTRTLRWLQ
jgi:carboxymethylenebutenolidase